MEDKRHHSSTSQHAAQNHSSSDKSQSNQAHDNKTHGHNASEPRKDAASHTAHHAPRTEHHTAHTAKPHDAKPHGAHHAADASPQPAAQGAFALLIPQLQRAVASEGYTIPTPIQAQAIEPLLAGKDLLGVAQTGTGKTAAFTLPLLQYLTQHKKMPSRGRPRSLILAPTRELAAQIGASIATYGKHLHITHTVIFGGVGQNPQVNAVTRGMDIVVATPGRLIDLMQQGFVRLNDIEVFVLDEADRMLDMGFIPDIQRIISSLPQKRQSLFFSATMPPTVEQLARSMLRNPVHVTIAPEQPTVERIKQTVMFVDQKDKDALLISLLKGTDINKLIVFAQMKHVANKVADKLEAAGIRAAAIHGNKSQTARTQALDAFRRNKVRVLVATDIAARGIDVDGITHVINYDLPAEPESYVHRIGRTARAGADGDAISFCCAEERVYLNDIERMIRKQLPFDRAQPFHSEAARLSTMRPPSRQQRGRSGPRRDGPRGDSRGGFGGGSGGRRPGGQSGQGGDGRRHRGPPSTGSSRGKRRR